MNRILTLITCICLSSFLARADVAPLQGGTKVQFNELPPAVQTSIKAQAGAAPIEDIDKGTLNGRVVYEAAYKKDGQHTELRVSEDGSVLDAIVAGKSTITGNANVAAAQATTPAQDAALPYHEQLGFSQSLSGAVKVNFDQLPANVKQIVRERAGSAQIEDIDKGTHRGNTVYQAAYKKNGKHTELRVTENGKWVREVQEGQTIFASDPSLVGRANVATAQATTPQDAALPYHEQLGFSQSLSGAVKINFDQLPANVKQIVSERAAGARIEDIDKGTHRGNTVYQAAYKKNGKHTELRVTENGKWVREVQQGRTIFASDPSLAGFSYELKNQKNISFDQLPANVKQIVKARIGNTPVGFVRQGTGVTPGSVVYQIGYNHNNQHGELRITQDGKFVKHVLGGKVIQESAGSGLE